MPWVERTAYVERLHALAGTRDTKVITGIRHSGKSELMKAFSAELEKADPLSNHPYSLVAHPIGSGQGRHDLIQRCKAYEVDCLTKRLNQGNGVRSLLIFGEIARLAIQQPHHQNSQNTHPGAIPRRAARSRPSKQLPIA